MKVTVECEKCKSSIELTPLTVGHHASIKKIEEDFRIQEIKFEHNFDDDAPPSEISDIDIRLEEIRVDCRKCGDYIVLNNFPSYVYNY